MKKKLLTLLLALVLSVVTVGQSFAALFEMDKDTWYNVGHGVYYIAVKGGNNTPIEILWKDSSTATEEYRLFYKNVPQKSTIFALQVVGGAWKWKGDSGMTVEWKNYQPALHTP